MESPARDSNDSSAFWEMLEKCAPIYSRYLDPHFSFPRSYISEIYPRSRRWSKMFIVTDRLHRGDNVSVSNWYRRKQFRFSEVHTHGRKVRTIKSQIYLPPRSSLLAFLFSRSCTLGLSFLLDNVLSRNKGLTELSIHR